MSSSFWIEKTIKLYFKILKDYWKTKKSLRLKGNRLTDKIAKELKMRLMKAFQLYANQRKRAASDSEKAKNMFHKNMKTKVLGGLLENLDLMGRSRKISAKHIHLEKAKSFGLWKLKFLNKISHKQILRRLLHIMASGAK